MSNVNNIINVILAPIGKLKFFLYGLILFAINILISEFYPEICDGVFTFSQFVVFPLIIYKRGRDINDQPGSFLAVYILCNFLIFYSFEDEPADLSSDNPGVVLIAALYLSLLFREREDQTTNRS